MNKLHPRADASPRVVRAQHPIGHTSDFARSTFLRFDCSRCGAPRLQTIVAVLRADGQPDPEGRPYYDVHPCACRWLGHE